MAVTIVNNLNPLSDNPTFRKTPFSNKFYTSKLLNWVEPIEISGKKKTVLYTELNCNFNIGDRVFIINGNYDSETWSGGDKYDRYSDGFRVIGRDGTRLVLDLDYTGVLPYSSIQDSDPIRVYHIRNQREFDYINSIKIPLNPMSIVDDFGGVITLTTVQQLSPKFSGEFRPLGSSASTAILHTNSIIYTGRSFSGSTDTNIANGGVTRDGFWMKINTTWQNISTEFLAGRIKTPIGNYLGSDKILIVGEDIVDPLGLNFTFRQRGAYTNKNGNWTSDNSTRQPYVSKLNFKSGKFRGKHYDGVYGNYNTKIKWRDAEWYSGALVNVDWVNGVMNSKSTTGEQSYYSTITSTASGPVQTIDFSDNRGFGYNLIEDCTLSSGNLKKGNFINCNILASTTFSAPEIYFGLSGSLPLTITGKFELCNIENSLIQNSNISNCEVTNCNIEGSSIINSQVIKSTAKSSEITDKNSITILGADLWSWSPGISQNSIGIVKLYISDVDLEKLVIGNSFYITKNNKEYFLNSLDNDTKVILPFETKYLLDYYFNSEVNGKIWVSIKSKNDNKLKLVAKEDTSGGIGTILTSFSNNTVNYASIDLESELFGYYLSSRGNKPEYNSLILNPIGISNINQFFVGAPISNSDFKSGYLEDSTWLSSNSINYYNNRIRKNGNTLDILRQSSTTLIINIERKPYNDNISIPGEDFSPGDLVWLSSVSHVDATTTDISGRYKVRAVSDNPNYISIFVTSETGLTFTSGGTYVNPGAEYANYSSIHKFSINRTTINSGLFRRTSITNSNFTNLLFDNTDKNLLIDNIKALRIINTIFSDTNNTVNSGLLYKSHFVNDNWNNGLVFNSIWNGGTFSNGIFNNSYWQNGTFNGGSFINCIDLTSTTQDYNTDQVYKNWLDGVFNNGEFYNSFWITGTFNNGRLYNSTWFTGTWNNGILGNNNIPFSSTKMGYDLPTTLSGATSTNWYGGIVENALVGGSGSVYWYGGKFADGEMTSFSSSNTMQTIWYNGDFIGGKITGLTRWKNGNFFKGKFQSFYGWELSSPTNSSSLSTNYGWENGRFYDGEFGNAATSSNSVWFNGEFRGGIFAGRYWNDGVFYKGEFRGSMTTSIWNSPNSQTVDFQAANTFTSSYFGLWGSGSVVDFPQDLNFDTLSQDNRRKRDLTKKEDNRVIFSNVLWLKGNFNHKNATIEKSLWLSGVFSNGTFDSGVFNPYVDRTFSGNFSDCSFATDAEWQNGTFNSTSGNGSFYFSNWRTGIFEKGYMSGAIWQNGTWNYGTAENILWQNGLWRNGNWNGSPFTYQELNSSNIVNQGRAKEIILNIADNLGSSNIHIINAFSASGSPSVLPDTEVRSVNGITSSFYWDPGTENHNPQVFNNQGQLVSTSPSAPGRTLLNSGWTHGTTFNIDQSTQISNPHIYTLGGTPTRPQTLISGYNWTNYSAGGASLINIPESHTLYAQLGLDGNGNPLREVFTHSNTTYEIRLQLTVELKEEVTIDFKIGNNNKITRTFASNVTTDVNTLDCYPRQYNIIFIYNTPANLTTDDKKFWLRKTSVGLVRILKASIRRNVTEYHPEYNNKIFAGVNSGSINLPPNNLSVFASSDTGEIVSINYGNGLFKSGVWENGIWNNGIRSQALVNESDYYRFSDIIGFNGIRPFGGKNSYQFDNNTWTITLKSLDSLRGLFVGDKISVGNIVAIDINEGRKLLKDFYRITNIDFTNGTITINVVTNFPIRRVEKDSSNHIIYVTKNIWLTGAFLNGYFGGIWNNGLFKGYPMITTMESSHWIDGKFDGGRFISTGVTDSISGLSYKSGVIQKFQFFDNKNRDKFTSWIDVNWDGYSKSYLNNESTQYILGNKFDLDLGLDQRLDGLSYSYSEHIPNLDGYITQDILESKSQLVNKGDSASQTYNLGTKFKVYENFIDNDGKFQNEFSNNLPVNINLDNFLNAGWTFSDFSDDVVTSTYSATTTFPQTVIQAGKITKGSKLFIDSNVNASTSNKLRIRNSLLFPNSIIYDFKPNSSKLLQSRFSGFLLENTNVDTLRNRYYVSSVDLATYSTVDAVYTHPNNNLTPAALQLYLTQSSRVSLEIVDGVNELLNPNPVKTHYFFNKSKLNLRITSESYASYSNVNITNFFNTPIPAQPPSPENRFDFTFNNISFKEVDMIPFFKYWESSDKIDKKVKTPIFATAPFIDYGNPNFNFIENVNLTIDRDTVIGQNFATIVFSVDGIDGSINGYQPTGTDDGFIV